MLEQAILDAKELKEAAIKNAQQALVEKYSNEFENEIEKLLEQAAPIPPAAPVMGAAPAPTAAGSAPVDPEKAKNDGDNKSDIFEKLEYAFKDGEVIEDKAYPTGVVEIDLDSLSEFSFKKNQEKTPEQMALQELKRLSMKEQVEEKMFDDEEDFDDEEEMGDEDDEDSDDLFPYGDSEDEDSDEEISDEEDEDEDLDDDFEDEEQDIDDEFTDEDDEDLDDDLYDSDEDEGEFEIDFETDPDDADYNPDADIEDEEFDDEDYEEDSEDDEEDYEEEESEEDEDDEEDELEEVKGSTKSKFAALATSLVATHGDVANLGKKVKEASKYSSAKHGKKEKLEETDDLEEGGQGGKLVRALKGTKPVETGAKMSIKTQKALDREKNLKKEGLKEAIKLDYKRTGPRSKWTGMFHEEAEHDVELANLQAQIEEMEQEVEHLQESNKKLKAGLKESIKMIEQITAEKDSYGKKVQQFEEKLYESRLLNYKLLYTNKALSDASLNERQKNKLAESINGAKTAEEVKLLYETLKSTMRDGTSSGRSPKSLSEAVERRSSSLLLKASRAEAPKQNDYAERMKKLAGLT